VHEGTRVRLRLNAEHFHFFHPESGASLRVATP